MAGRKNMELCKQCPMRDERYVPSDQVDGNTIRNQRVIIESYRDFIGWLFDESEHCDHISESEAREQFEAWREKQTITHSRPTWGVNRE